MSRCYWIGLEIVEGVNPDPICIDAWDDAEALAHARKVLHQHRQIAQARIRRANEVDPFKTVTRGDL